MSNFNINDDIIDSRDVIERIAELESQDADGDELTPDETAELTILQEFAAEAESVSDWSYGEQFIRDDYFTDYVKRLADEFGYSNNLDWVVVNWDATAQNVQQDYTDFSLNGVTYWARS